MSTISPCKSTFKIKSPISLSSPFGKKDKSQNDNQKNSNLNPQNQKNTLKNGNPQIKNSNLKKANQIENSELQKTQIKHSSQTTPQNLQKATQIFYDFLGKQLQKFAFQAHNSQHKNNQISENTLLSFLHLKNAVDKYIEQFQNKYHDRHAKQSQQQLYLKYVKLQRHGDHMLQIMQAYIPQKYKHMFQEESEILTK